MHLLSTHPEKVSNTIPASIPDGVLTESRVATIGNFDGVHRGHQILLKQLVEMARQKSAKATVITFEPYPEEYFRQQKAAPRLTRFEEKFHLLRRYGVDEIACLRFNRDLASCTPDQFVNRVLVARLRIQHLIVGDDFRFGHNRQGDDHFLRNAGRLAGFTVSPTATICVDQQRVSSTLVRNALQKADFDFARALMGHDYFITARVMHGDKRGRTLGFPTANLALARQNCVLQGVYAVDAEIENSKLNNRLTGIANVGIRPTVPGGEPRAEIHFFDFDNDLYGKKITVNFLHKIRDERKFTQLSDLTRQIAKDCQIARDFHQNRPANTTVNSTV